MKPVKAFRILDLKTQFQKIFSRKNGIAANAYHAGLSNDERTSVQEDWMSGRCKVGENPV